MRMGHAAPIQAEELCILDYCPEKKRVFFMNLATNRYKVVRVLFKDLATNRYKILKLYINLFIIFLFLKEVHENISHPFLRSFAI